MMTHPLLPKLRALKLSGMLLTLETRAAQASEGQLGPTEFLARHPVRVKRGERGDADRLTRADQKAQGQERHEPSLSQRSERGEQGKPQT